MIEVPENIPNNQNVQTIQSFGNWLAIMLNLYVTVTWLYLGSVSLAILFFFTPYVAAWFTVLQIAGANPFVRFFEFLF